MSQKLVPAVPNGSSPVNPPVASPMGVPFTDYNGNLTSNHCGRVGGELVTHLPDNYPLLP